MPDPPRKNLLNLTLAGLEELQHFPDEEQRQRAIDSMGQSNGNWELAKGIAITVTTGLVAFMAAKWVYGWLVPGAPPLAAGDFLSVVTAAIVVIVVVRWLHRRGADKDLREKLIACGVPVCMGCGYLLHGLNDSIRNCPECGWAIDGPVRRLLTPPPANAQPGPDPGTDD